MTPNLTDVTTIKHLLAKRDVRVSRSLGQNFLISREVVEAIGEVAAARDVPVTELGPGLGVITQELLGRGLEVMAIEMDDDFAEMLPTVVPPSARDRLNIRHADLKKEPWGWDRAYQVVGNIPYNLTGLIIRRLTQLDPAPEQAIVLVQREVGERIRENVPEMNLLALAIALWGEARLLTQVPAHCFWPQPDVASQLLLLTPNGQIGVEEREAIMRVAKIAFGQKRKQLQATLRKGLSLSSDQANDALQKAGLHQTQRPQEVAPEQWRHLTAALSSI